MIDNESHIENIQRQFTRQGAAYTKLNYVKNERGLEKIVGLARVGDSDHVLDVACGPGYLTMAFAQHCEAATGVDATDAFLDTAREEAAQRGLTNIQFINGNVEALEISDSEYDRVICRAAFHHFPAPFLVLKEMKRVCKPGGSVIVLDMIASEDTREVKRQDEIEKLCDPTHVHALSHSEFTDMFEKANLECVFNKVGETSYRLDEWIEHGGPDKENEKRIRDLMADAVDGESIGHPVWREDNEIHFAHRGMAYVLSV